MIKKIMKTMILTLFIAIASSSIVTALMIDDVAADNYYSYSCGGDYEVSQITADGNFTTVACYPNFNAGKAAMAQDSSYVLRHRSSKSPSKIIAMNNGLAYSFPGRIASDTLDIFERPNLSTSGNYKSTYVSSKYEMFYLDTLDYDTSDGSGVIEVVLNGFHGYVKLQATDLIPNQFLDTGRSIYVSGYDVSNYYESAYLVEPIRNYYRVVENDGRKELQFVNSYLEPYNGLQPSTYVLTIDVAPDDMKVGVKYYSDNGYEFYSDPNLKDYVTTFYPYYQFLPLRSKSNLSASDLNGALNYFRGDAKSALRDSGSYFKEAEEKYGVNALLLYSMAVHESAWGQSNFALNRNNLFGWNAYDSDPGKATYFKSVGDCVLQHAGNNLRSYLDIDDYRFFSMSLGNKGSGLNVKYASDPYWGLKIAAHAYSIDKYASGSGELKDNDKYPLSIINTFGVDFFYVPDDNTKRLYISNYGTTYQENFIVIPLGTEGEYTKFQFSNPITDNKIIMKRNVGGNYPYDFNSSVGYVRSEYLTPLNTNIKYESNYALSDVSLNGDKLTIVGNASTTNVVDDNVKVYLKDSAGYNYPMNVSVEGENINFNIDVNLNDLAIGEYTFKVIVDYSSDHDFSFDVKGDFSENSYVAGNRKYETVNNDLYTLVISKHEIENEDINSIDILKIDENGDLFIKGISFKTGYNYDNLENISHKLEVYDLVSSNTIESYDLTTIKMEGYDLNDGFNYENIGFEGLIDLSAYNYGSYGLRLNVSNGDLNYTTNISTTKKEFAMCYGTENEKTFKFSTNQNYRYRLEFEVLPSVYDLSLINKPTLRPTITMIENLSVTDGFLVFNGASYMKFANFGTDNNVQINFDLLREDGFKIDLVTEKVESALDYTEAIGDGYDLSDISFAIKYDISQLENGVYEIIGELSTDEYYDLYTLTDSRNLEYSGFTGNGKTYKIVVSEDRYRIKLIVEDAVTTLELLDEEEKVVVPEVANDYNIDVVETKNELVEDLVEE